MEVQTEALSSDLSQKHTKITSNCDRQNNCILLTIAAIVSSIDNGKFLLWQNEYNSA